MTRDLVWLTSCGLLSVLPVELQAQLCLMQKSAKSKGQRVIIVSAKMLRQRKVEILAYKATSIGNLRRRLAVTAKLFLPAPECDMLVT
jgi:hypothetical protein